jgi:hypothetical protein
VLSDDVAALNATEAIVVAGKTMMVDSSIACAARHQN